MLMNAADRPDRVAAELIRIQFRQMRRSSLTSLLVVLFVAHVAAIDAPGQWVIAWAGAYAVWYLSQEYLIYRFRRTEPDDAAIKPWGRAAAIALAVSGMIWGAGFYWFVNPEQPLTIGLMICAMAALTAGSIGFRSTILPGFYAYNLFVTVPLAVRFFVEEGSTFDLLGNSTVVFALVIANYGRAQHALIRDTLRIRFENVDLVEALRTQGAAADAAREAAEQANLAKSQFLAAASHDLRQPLYALGLFSSSLDDMKLDEEGRDVVRRIQDNIGAMEDSFEDLLDLSKLEAGIVQPRLVPVDVDALFDRISQVFRPLALERGLDLRLRSDGEWVLSDATLLEQVIGNLVSNAVRATTKGGILIAARRRAETLRFEIRDTGRGIEADDLKRIFDDYVQLDNPERNRRRGMGLGLAIARRSVALLGSQIDVVSRPGRGSCFGFAQPYAAATVSAAPGPAREAVTAPLGRRPDLPLLIVEDDDDVRTAISNLLARWGLPFEAFADAEAALARVQADREFGLLITDQRLSGGMSGLDLIRAIRTGNEDAAPAIIITGEVDSPLLRRAAEEGVAVLHKPVQAAKLRRLLALPDGETAVEEDVGAA